MQTVTVNKRLKVADDPLHQIATDLELVGASEIAPASTGSHTILPSPKLENNVEIKQSTEDIGITKVVPKQSSVVTTFEVLPNNENTLDGPQSNFTYIPSNTLAKLKSFIKPNDDQLNASSDSSIEITMTSQLSTFYTDCNKISPADAVSIAQIPILAVEMKATDPQAHGGPNIDITLEESGNLHDQFDNQKENVSNMVRTSCIC